MLGLFRLLRLRLKLHSLGLKAQETGFEVEELEAKALALFGV